MQAFDIEQLKTFVQVVESGSITAGSALVFLSQSAASEQLRKLEKQAGHRLLERGRHGVVPTAAGQLLLTHARRLLALSDEAWRELHGVVLDGVVRLGITDGFRPGEITQLLARLRNEYPALHVHAHMGKSREIQAAHAAGDLDLAITLRVDGKLSARARLVRNEPLRWMASPSYSQARSEPVRLVTLSTGCTLRQHAEKLLAQRGVAFDVVHVASGIAGMQAALTAGLGVACLNESALGEGVEVVPPRMLRLPAPGQVSFQMLPARRGEAPLVAQVRQLLARHLA